jgi:hypothetical protein
LRRLAIGALILLVLVLLGVGFWLPAKAELASRWLGELQSRPVATFEIGDQLLLTRPDGSTRAYEVLGLDVVDSERAQLLLDGDERIFLVTAPPSAAASLGGRWRYVVTARQADAATAEHSASF